MSEKGQNRAAVLSAYNTPLSITGRPIPVPGPKEILVRNHAVAFNRVDWLMRHHGIFVTSYPTVLGSDTAGIVEAVGSEVSLYKPGDRVLGFGYIIGTENPDNGAFQTYTAIPSGLVAPLPPSMSFHQGAALPMAVFTSAVAIFGHLGLPRLEAGQKVSSFDKAILIWGGSTSLGAAAIQIMHSLGFIVYTTASAKHHDYLRSLGADHTFDYHDSDVAQAITTHSNARVPISMAYDTASMGETLNLVIEILQKSTAEPEVSGEHKKLVHAPLWPAEIPKPQDLDVIWVDFTKFDLVEFGEWFANRWLAGALADGSFKSEHNLQVVKGGLEGIEAGLNTVIAGLSGTKLVLEID